MNTEELLGKLESIEQQLQTIAEDYSLPEFLTNQEVFEGEFDLLNVRLDTLTYIATIGMVNQIKESRIKIASLLKYVSFRRKHKEYSMEELVQAIDYYNYVKDFQNRLSSIDGIKEKKSLLNDLKKIKADWNILFPNTCFATFKAKL